MEQRLAPPENWFANGSSAVLLECPSGAARSQHLQSHLEEARRLGARTWLLDCDFQNGGPWAGIHDLFASLLEEIRRERPELLVRHDYELAHAVPDIQSTLRVRNPTLTDLAPNEEKVRNYPADRALRIVHGLIDLLDEWKENSATPWVIACDNFEGISAIGGRFLYDLMRRRGQRLRVTVLIGTSSVADSRKIWSGLKPEQVIGPIQVALPEAPDPKPDWQAMSLRAQELDAFIGEDRLRMQIHLPEILRCARLGERSDLLLKWQFRALEIYNTLGLYEEARAYGEAVRTALKGKQTPAHDSVRWAMFLKLIMCYLGLGQVETAYRLAEEEGIGQFHHPEWRSQFCYLMAMLHARYLPERDLEKAEAYLEEGIRALEGADLPEERIHFQYAFNRNGLAMVRHFQKRFDDALELCRTSHAHLEKHLSQDRHRLHRSVLLYNLAQVYASLGEREEAIAHYTAAMATDPNYSEYYNERGGLHLQAGRLLEARADFLKAIELSPPYFESFTNLGQCARLLGRMEEAVEAYSRALDLEPSQPLALLGRAQACEALGQWNEAVADYTAAIGLKPDQWDAVANRAVLLYQLGRVRESLADLDRAIELAPAEADLYENRSIAFEALREYDAAARDLRMYLQLTPEATDGVEAARRLRTLEAAVPV